ncbi:MAG TPA: hypothetical protein VFB66_31730, partial [Tepidisphaeraceae bacterium]|nr:hypothetical protein [Tepidisphaeraceae bacterium]
MSEKSAVTPDHKADAPFTADADSPPVSGPSPPTDPGPVEYGSAWLSRTPDSDATLHPPSLAAVP